MTNSKILLTFFLALAVLIATESKSQVVTPQASPTATLSQKIGLTDVEIVYSRPSVKGRTIFGDLVPYDQVWRTGANSPTKITFSDDVEIGGQKVPKGSYALFTIPGKTEWTVVVNKNLNQWGSSQYNDQENVAKISVKSQSLSRKVETFTINIGNMTSKSADIELAWENTLIAIPVKVFIDEKIEASIKKSLRINPGDYNAAASYYFESGKDLNQALEWINKALEAYEKDGANVFWVYRQKSLIQAGLKDYKGAIATAETSLAKAKEANNDDYVRLNEKSIAEWKGK